VAVKPAIALLAGIAIGAAVVGAGLRGRESASAAPDADPSAAPPSNVGAAAGADASVWAISFVRARPGQRERLQRYLRANWLVLDAKALEQGRIAGYRMLRADESTTESWDYAVIIEYPNRQAMQDFVPAYLDMLRAHPKVRVDGLDFADLGDVVQQNVVEPVANLDAAEVTP